MSEEENTIQNTIQQYRDHEITKINRQADVLDQTRLRPLGTSVNPITNKNLTAETEGKMLPTHLSLYGITHLLQ
jgi:hypothetical protein